MEILKETSSGSFLCPIETEYFDSRVLFLEGEIDEECAIRFEKSLGELIRRDKEKDVLLVIHSYGGSILAGMEILDAIEDAPCKIHTYCPQMAYSMGAVLFICGTGKRVIGKRARLMLHEPLVRKVGDKGLSSIEEMTEQLRQGKEDLKKILREKTGVGFKELDKILKEDHFYTGKEATEKNFADEIGSVRFLASFQKEDW